MFGLKLFSTLLCTIMCVSLFVGNLALIFTDFSFDLLCIDIILMAIIIASIIAMNKKTSKTFTDSTIGLCIFLALIYLIAIFDEGLTLSTLLPLLTFALPSIYLLLQKNTTFLTNNENEQFEKDDDDD